VRGSGWVVGPLAVVNFVAARSVPRGYANARRRRDLLRRRRGDYWVGSTGGLAVVINDRILGTLALDPLPQIPQPLLFHSPLMHMRHRRLAQKKEDAGEYY
jgi:hypothetical protein